MPARYTRLERRLGTGIMLLFFAFFLADVGYRGSLAATAPRAPGPAAGLVLQRSYRGVSFYVSAEQDWWLGFLEYGSLSPFVLACVLGYAVNRRRRREAESARA